MVLGLPYLSPIPNYLHSANHLTDAEEPQDFSADDPR
jgi:hypothetical protein